MQTVNDNYPGKDPATPEQLKAMAMASYKQEQVHKVNFPTEIIELPSKGLLYPEDSPLASGKIEMKYMTAREEDILTSANLIKQGVVLDKLFQALIVSPIDYNELLIGDKNAIMIAARVLGYGKDYEVEINDPTAPGEKQKVVIDLASIEPKEYDFDSITPHQNVFEYTLPTSKRVVQFRLATHGLEQQIKNDIKSMIKITKASGVDKEITTRLKATILSVDGNSERAFINKFVDEELFAMDSRALREEMRRRTPDMDLTFVFTSAISGETTELDIPMDVSFFWPKA